MAVEISGYDPDKASEIQAAAEREWPFSDWWLAGNEDESEPKMQASAEHSLAGGESEEEFTERLSLAIWRANGGFCEVVVSATFLENLPYEIHTLDEDDYERLMKANTGEMSHENDTDRRN
jgi:hypothetical protein